MRRRETLLIVALVAAGVVFQAVAGPSAPSTTSTTNAAPVLNQQAPAQPAAQPTVQDSPTPSATTTISKKGFSWFTADTSTNQTEIHWDGDMSSRPWDAPEWHVGQTQFPDGENHQSQLVLFQLGW